MTTAFVIVDSASFAVNSTPVSYTPSSADPNVQNNPKPSLLRVWSDVDFLVRTDGQPVTADSMPVAQKYEGVLLSIPPGESISAMAQGAGSGTIWFTRVKRV